MPVDNTDFVLLQLNRVVASLMPPGVDEAYSRNLVSKLMEHITHNERSSTLDHVLEELRMLFLSSGKSGAWETFHSIIRVLVSEGNPEVVSKHLVYLSQMASELNQPQRPATTPHTTAPSEFATANTSFGSKPHTASMAALIAPHYQTFDEPALIACLQHTLLGQDTKSLPFSADKQEIRINESLNVSNASLLKDILEPALLYKGLSIFLEETKGQERSPIKTAFIRFTESCVSQYCEGIEKIYQDTPATLLTLQVSLATETVRLRLLSYLKNESVTLDGYQFLLKLQSLSQFGDLNVKEFATRAFQESALPYYEYIEHWILRGELIDENKEFFISFDVSKNHINDIIVYNSSQLPKFLMFNDETYRKILEVGKTLVFLENYCQDLEWVNQFTSRFYKHLFEAHNGLKSMSANASQEMINCQYLEVLNRLTNLLHFKFGVFQHLLAFKKVMLMESSDFVESLNQKGYSIFSEPAISLTSGRLSELLFDSIEASSIKNMPSKYRSRIDARILDLSHGTIGWDVFTLDYKVPEAPLDSILNYQNETTQYLRLFNFLWGLRHFRFSLDKNYVEYKNLQKTDLRILRNKTPSSKYSANTAVGKRLKWFLKSVRTINLIRNRLLVLIQGILNFVSLDLIEDNFNEKIVRKLFQTTSITDSELVVDAGTNIQRLPLLNKAFLSSACDVKNLNGLQKAASVKHNVKECTLDQLTSIHKGFLRSITESKLLREDARGRYSGVSFVDQIFEFLDITFAFVKSSEEFAATLSNYVSILSVRRGNEGDMFDEDLDELHQRLNSMMKMIGQDIYAGRFEPRYRMFLRDLRGEMDLKDLSKNI